MWILLASLYIFRLSKPKERTFPTQVILKVIHRERRYLCTKLAHNSIFVGDGNFGNKSAVQRYHQTRSGNRFPKPEAAG